MATIAVPADATSTAAAPVAVSLAQLDVDRVVAAAGVDAATGLGDDEARRRLAEHGPNQLPSEPPLPAWRRLLEQLRNPLTLLLLAATAISLVAWLIERESSIPFETLTIVAIIVINAALGFIQEARAEQAVAALSAMTAASARVLRGGHPRSVPTADLVPGDIVLIEEGDTLPADGRLIEAIALRVAEAALTGESSPVWKETAALAAAVGIGDQVNMVWKGTAATSGRGRAVVTATGVDTELGKIARSLQQVDEVATPLQRELDRTGRLLGLVVIAIAVIMTATIVVVGEVRSLSELTDVLLLGVSLAVAAVPEGLTAITTIVLSLGMQRMAARHVIVRTLSAVETLGSTTVICTDKTGTLTKNEMTVRTVVTGSGRVELTGIGYRPDGEVQQGGQPVSDEILLAELRLALGAADLASNASLDQVDDRWSVTGDPTEGALLVAAHKLGVTPVTLATRFTRVAEVPFSSERKLMSTASRDAEASRLVLTTKGAPDVLLARCSAEWVAGAAQPLSEQRRGEIRASVEALAGDALRTIGIAHRVLADGDGDGIDDSAETGLVWLGLVGMIDPPRPEAAESVRLARRAGIRIIMITGDHPSTATAIGAELGITAAGAATVTGGELQQMDDASLRQRVATTQVYARVAPDHKLRIVQALKAGGAVVAMTGDGVNDAPALKQADIGVAMGITGTDVSKGAADMILTDDNFASIVAAIEEGRSLFANIQMFLRYLLSSNIGEVLVMFLGVVLAGVIGLESADGTLVLPLLATQILWINLLTDSAPALALGVEPADAGVMEQPARDPRSRVVDRAMWTDIVFGGVVMAAGTLAVMDWALAGGLITGSAGSPGSLERARTLAFTTLVCFQLFNVFNARSSRHTAFRHLLRNRWLWLAVLVSAALHVAVVYLPLLQQAFATVPLAAGDWLVCVGVGSSVLWTSEARKLVLRARHRLALRAPAVVATPPTAR